MPEVQNRLPQRVGGRANLPALQEQRRMAQRRASDVIPRKCQSVAADILIVTRWPSIICFVVAVSGVAPATSGCAFSAEEGSNSTVTPVTFTDFSSLLLPDTPNNWLVAPADFSGAAKPDETAPAFGIPANALADAWRAVIRSRPRATILARSEDGLQIEAEQKSAVFGFVDRISVRVLPLDAERSTFVAYSISQVGYWDMGVNRGRLRDWISALEEKTAAVSR